jgi:hypothetical protein
MPGYNQWLDCNAQPNNLSTIQHYQQAAHIQDRYVEVVHSSDVLNSAEGRVTDVEDVEEAVAPDADEPVVTYESGPGLLSRTSSSDQLSPYDSTSGSSSYLNVSSPVSLRRDSTQNSIAKSGNGSITEVTTPEGFVNLDHSGPRTDERPKERQRKQHRKQFDSADRDETNKTRILHACVSCRAQKVRVRHDFRNNARQTSRFAKRQQCVANRDDPSRPCEKCEKKAVSTSGKVFHRAPCVRADTISALVLFRPGGVLSLTKRWEGTKMVDVGDWADPNPDSIRTIHIAQGLFHIPFMVRVRKFIPREGDVLYRRWSETGKQDLEPYCLADIHQTARRFSSYLATTAFEGLRDAAKKSCSLVSKTYDMAIKHAYVLEVRFINRWFEDALF